MMIDLQIEALRSILNAEIIKSDYALTSNAVLSISRKLDELLIVRYNQIEEDSAAKEA